MPIRCLGCMMEVADASLRRCPYCNNPIPLQRDGVQRLAPGSTLQQNRFLIGRCLGQGGFGITYLAWDNLMQGTRAIKEYFPSKIATRLPTSPEIQIISAEMMDSYRRGLRSFKNEAVHLEELRDVPGVVRIYTYFEENNTGYLVMEFLSGMTLSRYIQQNHSFLTIDEANRILLSLLEVVRGIHSKAILIDGKSTTLLHRDISTDNIFITQDGKITLLDFGSAREEMQQEYGELTNFTKAGYSAPEQISNGRQGTYTDLYAVGVCYYKLLTGRLPVMNPDGELASIREEQKNIPIWVDQIFHKATHYKAADRYQTADEFIRDLKNHIHNKKPLSKGIIVLSVMLGVVVLTIVIVLGVALMPPKEEKPRVTDEPLRTVSAGLETRIENPTDVLTLAPTDTPTPVPTDTPEPAATDTPEPAATDTPEPVPTDTPTPVPTDTPTPVPTDTPTPSPTDTPTLAPTEAPTVAAPSLLDIPLLSQDVCLGDTAVIEPVYADGLPTLSFVYNQDVVSVNTLEDGRIEIAGLTVGGTDLAISDDHNTFRVHVNVTPVVTGISEKAVLLEYDQPMELVLQTQDDRPAPEMSWSPDIDGLTVEQDGKIIRMTAAQEVDTSLTLEGGGAKLTVALRTRGMLQSATLYTCAEDALTVPEQWTEIGRYFADGKENFVLLSQAQVTDQRMILVPENSNGQFEDVIYSGGVQAMSEEGILVLDQDGEALAREEGMAISLSDGRNTLQMRVAVGEAVTGVEALSALDGAQMPIGTTTELALNIRSGMEQTIQVSSTQPDVVQASLENGTLKLDYIGCGRSEVLLNTPQGEMHVTLNVLPVLQDVSVNADNLYVGDTVQIDYRVQGTGDEGLVIEVKPEGFWPVERADGSAAVHVTQAGTAMVTVRDAFGKQQSYTCTALPLIPGIEPAALTLHHGETCTANILCAPDREPPEVSVVSVPEGLSVSLNGNQLTVSAEAYTSGEVVLSALNEEIRVAVSCQDAILSAARVQPDFSTQERNRTLRDGVITLVVQTWSGSMDAVTVEDAWRVSERSAEGLTLEPNWEVFGSLPALRDLSSIRLSLGEQTYDVNVSVANGVFDAPASLELESARPVPVSLTTVYGTLQDIALTSADESMLQISETDQGIVLTGGMQGQTELVLRDAYGELRIPVSVKANLNTLTYLNQTCERGGTLMMEGAVNEPFTLQATVYGGDLSMLPVSVNGEMDYTIHDDGTIVISSSSEGASQLAIDGTVVTLVSRAAWRFAQGANDTTENVLQAQEALVSLGYPILQNGRWSSQLSKNLAKWRADNGLPGSDAAPEQQALTEEEFQMLLAQGAQARENAASAEQMQVSDSAARQAGDPIVVRQMGVASDQMLYMLDDQGYLERFDPASGTIAYACLGNSDAHFTQMFAESDYLLLKDDHNFWYQIGRGNLFSDDESVVYGDADWMRMIYPAYDFDLVAASETAIAARLSADIVEENLSAGMVVYWTKGWDAMSALHTAQLATEQQNTGVTALALRGSQLLYVTSAGNVMYMGPANAMASALNVTNAASHAQEIAVRVEGQQVNPLVKDIAMNDSSLALVLTDGTVIIGGDNLTGLIGEVGNMRNNSFTYVTYGGAKLGAVRDAAATDNAVYLLLEDGSLYACTQRSVQPIAQGISTLDAGGSMAYAVTEDRKVLMIQGTEVSIIADGLTYPGQSK